MSIIYHNTVNTGLCAENVVARAERLIRCTARYQGLAFGGYVRDIVIPLHRQGSWSSYMDTITIKQWQKDRNELDCAYNRKIKVEIPSM